MVLRPVGDLPPRVYWVRRLLVLLVVVVVLLLVWWLWPGGGDDTASTGAQQASPTPPLSITPTPSVSPEPSQSKTTKTSDPTDQECADDDVAVTVRTDSSSYPAGENPAITFAVENVSDQTCVRDVGSAANELRISSGGVTVWSSDFCSTGGDEDLTTLEPGDPFEVETYSWNRILTSKGCPTPQEQADPGTYEVIAINGDAVSEPARFSLE